MRFLFISVLTCFSAVYIYAQQGNPSASIAGQTDPDTLAIYTSKPEPSTGYLKFANAFRWNHAGPTGGYWSENNTDDYTFRPVYSNVASYKLIIFHRSGHLVYESTDLHKGWDGYLRNGTVAAQGVYVWKATGKYTDGTSFNLIGDVTFLH